MPSKPKPRARSQLYTDSELVTQQSIAGHQGYQIGTGNIGRDNLMLSSQPFNIWNPSQVAAESSCTIPHCLYSLELHVTKASQLFLFTRKTLQLTKLRKPLPHASTVTSPSTLTVTKLFASGPHATAVAGTAVLMTSDHDLELLVYCEMVSPRGPEAARYCPV